MYLYVCTRSLKSYSCTRFVSAKLKSIFNEAGVFQGIIYVLLLKLSASLTKNHGMAPGGEFRRALKEVGIPDTVFHSL